MESLFCHKVGLYVKLSQEGKVLKAEEVVLVSGDIPEREVERAGSFGLMDCSDKVRVFGGTRNIRKGALDLPKNPFVVASDDQAPSGEGVGRTKLIYRQEEGEHALQLGAVGVDSYRRAVDLGNPVAPGVAGKTRMDDPCRRREMGVAFWHIRTVANSLSGTLTERVSEKRTVEVKVAMSDGPFDGQCGSGSE